MPVFVEPDSCSPITGPEEQHVNFLMKYNASPGLAGAKRSSELQSCILCLSMLVLGSLYLLLPIINILFPLAARRDRFP